MASTRPTTSTSSSSVPAAPGCGRPSRPSRRGLRTALVCKSLLGKAHTVMAEGGIAAALGNVYPEDNWKVHFRDTMRGGKMLNNWRMAQLHAQEAPDRVRELEDWGALFDRTEDGLILQRDFGGHRFARLAHVGDRTGLEMIRTLQQKAVADGIEVFMECKVLRLLHDADGDRLRAGRLLAADRASSWSSRPRRSSWPPAGSARAGCTPPTRGSRPATGTRWPCGPAPTSSTWSSSSSTRPAWSGRCRYAASWSPKACAATAASCATRRASGSCSTTSPPMFAAETADSEDEADKWYDDHSAGRRPPELLPRDEVARSINTEVKAGRGSPHGGVFLDIATRRTRRGHPPAAAVDVPPVQGAGRRGHHRRGHGGRADLPLHHGRRPGRRRHRGHHRARAVRRRRGGRRDARRQPARRQLALRPAGLRPAGRDRGGRVRLGPIADRLALDEGQIDGDHRRRPSPPSSGTAARTPTTSSTTCRRPCRASSASSAPGPSSTRPWAQLDELEDRADQGRRSAVAGATTRAGTSPPTCPPC